MWNFEYRVETPFDCGCNRTFLLLLWNFPVRLFCDYHCDRSSQELWISIVWVFSFELLVIKIMVEALESQFFAVLKYHMRTAINQLANGSLFSSILSTNSSQPLNLNLHPNLVLTLNYPTTKNLTSSKQYYPNSMPSFALSPIILYSTVAHVP